MSESEIKFFAPQNMRRSAAAALSFGMLVCCLTAFTGCSSAAAEKIDAPDALPSAKGYSSEAQSLREEETVTVTVCSTSTETIVSAAAASSETEESNEIAESVLAAISEAMLDVSLKGSNGTSGTVSEVTETEMTEAVTEPSETAAETVSESAAAETAEITDSPVPESEKVPEQTVSDSYDREFFAEDLFIGDSITTGYSLYGFLDEKNVFAKIGLNPSTVLSKPVPTCYGDISVSEMLEYTMPKRVYIMLGSNGIQWLSCKNMLDSSDMLAGIIHDKCPDAEIVFVSVPPVTAGYDSTVADVDVMAKINEYNAGLAEYCSSEGLYFIDISKVLKDTTGYFSATYAESDGMHFKSSAYKVILSAIQSAMTEIEASMPEEELPEAEETEMTEEAESESTEASDETETEEETAADETTE
ncbi:MAG: GDSL-type esterase/lipase family protein [Huintestinicola sp.]